MSRLNCNDCHKWLGECDCDERLMYGDPGWDGEPAIMGDAACCEHATYAEIPF